MSSLWTESKSSLSAWPVAQGWGICLVLLPATGAVLVRNLNQVDTGYLYADAFFFTGMPSPVAVGIGAGGFGALVAWRAVFYSCVSAFLSFWGPGGTVEEKPCWQQVGEHEPLFFHLHLWGGFGNTE